MLHYALAAWLASVFTLSIGAFVYFRDPRNRVFLLFLLINISVSVWTLGTFYIATSAGPGEAIWWNRISYLFGAFIPAFFANFIFELIGYKPGRKFYKKIYGLAVFFAVISFSNYFVRSMVSISPDYNFLPRPNIFYTLFVAYFFILLVYVYFRLLAAYLAASGARKKQFFYLMIASIIGFVGTGDFFLMVYNISPRLPFPHDYPIIAYTLIFAYAILKHHLMDIEIIIKKSFVFAGLFAAIIAIYSLPLFIFQNLFQQTLGLSQSLAAAFTILAVMFGYERLKNFLIEVTDKYLFQKKYEYRKALAELGKETTRLMKLDTFTKILNRNVVRAIKLSGSSVVILNKKKKQYVFLAAARNHKENNGQVFPHENILIPELQNVDYLLADDLERVLRSDQIDRARAENLKSVLEVFREYKTVLCVPSRFEKEVIGFMLFGEKLSQDPYSEEDLDLFVTISRQIALAVNNSYLYEESLEKERELAKKELEKQTEKIRRLASLGELASGVAHEIRNPMTVLRSRAEDLKNEIDNKEYLLEFADLTVKHIDRILNIVNNMLNFAKEREKTIFADVDINQVINDTIVLVAGRFKSKGIEIEKNLVSRKMITGDPNALGQAVLNIMMNSFDFMGEGGKLTVNTRDRANLVEVEISDTGCGIPGEKVEHIFDPFFTTRVEGTGLGLSITHRIIQDHGGSIAVSSQVGQGTKFVIIFPAESR